MMALTTCSASSLSSDWMSTIPSVDLGMAALSGIASANISIAVPVLSQNLCYVAIPDSRTGAVFFSTASRRRTYTNISDAIYGYKITGSTQHGIWTRNLS